MSLVLAMFLAPGFGGGNDDMGASLAVASQEAGRWTAMSVLWSVSAAGFVLGCPTIILALVKRGRLLGYVGVVLFAIGAIGLTGFAALSLMFQSMAEAGVSASQVETVLGAGGLRVVETVWIIGLFGGLVVIAVALLIGRALPIWVPLMLIAFVGIQLLFDDIEFVQKTGWVALALGFTGIAIEVAAPPTRRAAAANL